MKDFDISEVFNIGAKSPTALNSLSKEKSAYLRGVRLAQPIKVIDSNGIIKDLFDDSSYEDLNLKNGSVDAELSDPISGRTIKFTDAESFAEAQKLLEEIREEELQKKLHNELIAKSMILISSAGSPQQTESYYKSAVESLTKLAKFISGVTGVDFQSFSKGEYSEIPANQTFEGLQASINGYIDSLNQKQQDAVVDAIKANLSFMSLAELLQYASRFPSVNSIIKSRLDLIKKAGLTPISAQFKSGTQLAELVSSNKRKAVINNLKERSDGLDFGKVVLGTEPISAKKLRDKLDWYPTIDIA